MKKKWKIILICLAIALVVFAGVSFMMRNKGQQVEVVSVSKQDVEDWYTEEGTLASGDEYRVIAEVSGPIDEIMVEENSQVKKGDLLFSIDSSDYEYGIASAKSALAGFKAQLEKSRIDQLMTVSPQEYLDTVMQELTTKEAAYKSALSVYESSQVLYDSGVISKSQLDADSVKYESALASWQQSKERYEESSSVLKTLRADGISQDALDSHFYDSIINQLTAQIEAQNTDISQMEDQIKKCRVTAEKGGVILSLPIRETSAIQAGETAVVISSREDGEIKAQADVLTNTAPYINPGTPAEVILQLRGKDESFFGTVESVYDYASPGTSSLGLNEYRVHVEVNLPESDALKGRNGYGVNIKFLIYSGEDCLSVPSSAVFQSDDEYFVYQIKNGRAVKTPIKIEYQTSTHTVIANGINEGDIVIDKVDSEGIYDGAEVYQ